MNNRKLIIFIAIVLLILIGLIAYLVIPQSTPPTIPEPTLGVEMSGEEVEFTFPASVEEVDWDNREIYKSGLTEAAQSALSDLPMASTYYITLELQEDISADISGHQMVRYFNAEDQDLDVVYFRLFPNFEGGKSTVSNLKVDGADASINLEYLDTTLRVDLPKTLAPGDSVVFEMDFSLGIPTDMGGNYGLYGYFDDVLVLDTFYPMIPAFDEKDGWYSGHPQQNGDHTYNDASFYVVQVNAPADVKFASSGVIIGHQVDDGAQVTTFTAGPARDFYLGGSRKYVELKETIGDLTVRVLTFEEYNEHQRLALDFAKTSIEIFSDRVGDYPYTEFEVISSPMMALGIEYPGITSIVNTEFDPEYLFGGTPSAIYLESTTVHEVAHMWFYNTVGNDQQNEPWLDEALVQYLTYIYYLDRYGPQAGSSYNSSWYGRWERVEMAEIPIGLPAGEYYDEETGGLAYGAIVYGRGPIFFLELEEQLGLDTLMTAIQNYYQDHLWGVGQPEDLLAALESSCACELDDIWNEWVYGTQ